MPAKFPSHFYRTMRRRQQQQQQQGQHGSSSCLLLMVTVLATCLTTATSAATFLPLLDGGKDIPVLSPTYQSYFDATIAKQASTAVAKAVAAGKTKLEVQFPPVPNLDEVKFGTPLNQKFGKNIVAKELRIPGGYYPGSDISRFQVAFANMYWAKV